MNLSNLLQHHRVPVYSMVVFYENNHYLLVYLTDGVGRVYVRTWPNYISPEPTRMQDWYPSGRQPKGCVLQPQGSPWVFHSFLLSLVLPHLQWESVVFNQCLTNNGRQPPLLFLKRARLLPHPWPHLHHSGVEIPSMQSSPAPEHSPEKLRFPVAE